ncbi:curli-like amyloid fiber formation chaperone CsgH [Oceanomicrobium pacificus]|uniref:CsgH-like domain-containing protein n=1 Tax=Oceanomicrobium pacificus TaxID=2692916 RepID=A0A6B0TZC3_9RHOB|nr:curli-like amyloid fiber formation chaperone CsgH [Oceanomicrobium pacificus]MXU66758.1 hypothetical protein [Oceanomicrobium pacificus]
MSNLECEIRKRAHAAGFELVGVVRADHKVNGTYSFIVNRTGPAGSSNVSQRGMFTLASGKPAVVGSVALNRSAGDQYLIRLTVQADGREKICDATFDDL